MNSFIIISLGILIEPNVFVIWFWFTESDMWRQLDYETYICHLETVYSPPHEFSHFLEHPLLTPLPYKLGFYCFYKPLLVTDTHYCITLEVHFNTYSESIEHFDNRTISDLSHGLRWLHLEIWFGTLFNKGTKARGLDCELTLIHPHILFHFYLINQLNYSPWSVLENIRLAFITLTTRRYGNRKSTTGKELDISDVSITNHFYLS